MKMHNQVLHATQATRVGELIPPEVNSFFQNYMETLENAPVQYRPLMFQHHAGHAVKPPVEAAATACFPASTTTAAGMTPQGIQMMLMPTFEGMQPSGAPQPQPRTSTESGAPMDSPIDDVPVNVEGWVNDREDEHDEEDGNAKRRTARQQLQNQRAQRRYRERKKQKAQELEGRVEVLSARVKQLEAVAAENAQLQGKAQLLEQTVQLREQEIQLLRHEQEQVEVLLEGHDHSGDEEATAGLCCSDSHCAARAVAAEAEYSAVFRTREAQDRAIQQAEEQWEQGVGELRALVQGVPGGGRDVRASVGASELGALVEKTSEINQVARRAMVLQGPNMWHLVQAQTADKRNLDNLAHWSQTIERLEMSPQVVHSVVDARHQHLDALEDIYRRRQELNQQAIRLHQAEGGAGPSAAQHAGGHSTSLLARAEHASQVAMVLEHLKANLREEQCAAVKFSQLVCGLLSPMQQAVFILACHPLQADPLQLANVLHEEGKEHHNPGTPKSTPAEVDAGGAMVVS